MNRYLKCLLLCLIIIGAGRTAVCQTYIFAQLTGAPMNTTGWNLAGDAHVGNIIGVADSELIVCRDAFENSGAVFYNQPINLAICNKWIAEFDFRMYDGTGADGMAFCFLDVPPAGYVNGGGLGIPDSANGLKVCFDTWNNCIPFDSALVHWDMPKIEIRWGIGYNETIMDSVIYGECVDQPTLVNTNGALSYIRGPKYNRAMIVYDTGLISVYVNDTLYLTAYQPHEFNFTGYMGFTASTGGYDDNHSIKNVIIYTQMPPSFAGNSQAFCPYDTVQLGGPGNPTYTYTWSPPTGLSDTTSPAPFLHLANNTSDSALHKYFVRTGFGTNPGCASVDSVTVKLYPNPTVNFTMPKICLNDAIGQFYDSSYTADAETLPFTYNWYFGDPNASPPGNLDYSNLQNPTHRYSAAANYHMSLAVKNSEGCVDSASKVFTVNGDDPEAVFQVLNPTGLCSNTAVQLSNLSTVNFGSVVAVQIFWGDTAGVSYMDSMPYSGKIYSHHYPDPVTTGTANYTIRMIAASGLTCQNETDQSVTINPSPHAQFAAIPTLCDIDTAVSLTEGSELTGLAGDSAFSGRGVSPGGVLDPLQAGVGTDTLMYTFNAIDGCSDTAYQTVFIQSLPRVRAGDDTAVVIGQPLQLNAWSSDGTGDIFLWAPPEGLNNPGIADPIAVLGSGIDSIRYVVTATDSVGCFGQSSLKVVVFSSMPDLFVPNAFTPGRGTNAIFRPIPVGISRLLYFSVYNRLGGLVYSTSRMGEGWDGTLDGKQQTPGVYVWVAEAETYTGRTIARRGTVILVR
jgi:Bacterial lectin/CHU_C Type IX secretion signal domain/PKD domain